jgi:hypothetical protein
MRIFLVLLAIISASVLPPWCTVAIFVILCIRYRAWEVPFIGLLADMLWLPTSATFFAHLPWMTIIAIALLWLSEPIRERFVVST